MEMISFAYSLLLTKTLKNEGTIVEKTIDYHGGGIALLCVGEGVMKSTLHP